MPPGRSPSALIIGVLLLSGCATPSGSDLATGAGSSAGSAAVSSPAEPSATPESTPSPSTASVHWEQLTTVEAPDPYGDFRLLGAFDGGYVALQRSPPAALFSEDGLSWTRTVLKAPKGFAGSADTIASNGESILVGGDYVPCTERDYSDDPFHACRPRPVSWVSSDGLDWQSSGRWEGPNGEEGRSGSSFLTAWSVPTGGWDAGQMFSRSDESDDFEPTGPAIWHSSDGVGWTPLTDDPGRDVACGSFRAEESFRAAADATGRRVATTSAYEGCPFPVYISSDGQVYAKVEGFPADGQTYLTVVLPPVEGWPWRLFGGGDLTGQGNVWSSTDLAAWTTTKLNVAGHPSVVVLAATHAADRDVAVGRIDRDGTTWTSDDGWSWLATTRPEPAIETVAHGPAGTLGLVGTWSEDGNGVTGFEVWRLVDDR